MQTFIKLISLEWPQVNSMYTYMLTRLLYTDYLVNIFMIAIK